jgi:hypothetical protein
MVGGVTKERIELKKQYHVGTYILQAKDERIPLCLFVSTIGLPGFS